MSKQQLIINTPENSTTSSFDHTDRSLMSKRVRALLHDKEGSEILFTAITKERNNEHDLDVTITPELLERLKTILRNESENSDNSGNEDLDKTEHQKNSRKKNQLNAKAEINEHSFFSTVFRFLGWSHTKRSVSHNH